MKLYEIAHSRTGDKGNISIISVIPYNEEDYALVKSKLTINKVQEHFDFLPITHIERYEIDSLPALNFVCIGALDGGVTSSLRLDRHGKSLSFHLLEINLD